MTIGVLSFDVIVDFYKKKGYYAIERVENYQTGGFREEIIIQGNYGEAEIPDDCSISLAHSSGDTAYFGGKSEFEGIPVRVSVVVKIDKIKELL